MIIESKDTNDVFHHLQDGLQINSWAVLPEAAQSIDAKDIRLFETHAAAAKGIGESGSAVERPVVVPLMALMEAFFEKFSEAGEQYKHADIDIDLPELQKNNLRWAGELMQVEVMLEQLKPYGIGGMVSFELNYQVYTQPKSFTFSLPLDYGPEQLTWRISFDKKEAADDYLLSGLSARLRNAIEIPAMKINGIETEKLDQQMAHVNWQRELVNNRALPDDPLFFENVHTPGIIASLEELRKAGKEGEMIASMLQYKYWGGTDNEGLIPNKPLFDAQYVKHITNDLRDLHLTVDQSYNLLKGRPAGVVTGSGLITWYTLVGNTVTPFMAINKADYTKMLEKLPLAASKEPSLKEQLIEQLLTGGQVKTDYLRPEGPVSVQLSNKAAEDGKAIELRVENKEMGISEGIEIRPAPLDSGQAPGDPTLQQRKNKR